MLGIVRMLLEFTIPAPLCGQPETRPTILYKVHYLYFGMISTACTIIISICVSLVTPPIDDRCVSIPRQRVEQKDFSCVLIKDIYIQDHFNEVPG